MNSALDKYTKIKRYFPKKIFRNISKLQELLEQKKN